MPTAYAGTDTYPATFDIPSGGDTRNAASVNTALEALGNRTKWLKNRAGLYRIAQVSDAYADSTSWTTLGSTDQATWGTGDVKVGEVTIEENDVVKVRVGFHAGCVGGTVLAGHRLVYSLDGGTKYALPGAIAIYGSIEEAIPVMLSGQHWIGVGEAGAGALELFIQGQVGFGSTLQILSPMSPWIEVLRSNA